MNRPAFQIAVWRQPPELFERWASRGINTVIYCEVGAPARMTAPAYCKAAEDAGLWVISDQPIKAPNICGYMIGADEPNAKLVNGQKINTESLKTQYKQFKTLAPDLPVYLSLAGDAITNGAPWKDYDYGLAPCDAVWVNAYSMNRNASRYGTTWTADAIRKLSGLFSGAIHAMVECDWQGLRTDPVGVGRAPTADEYEGTVMSALLAGASGLAIFATAVGPNVNASWPERYDMTRPDVDARMKQLHPRLQAWASGRACPMSDDDQLNRIESKIDAVRTTLAAGMVPRA